MIEAVDRSSEMGGARVEVERDRLSHRGDAPTVSLP